MQTNEDTYTCEQWRSLVSEALYLNNIKFHSNRSTLTTSSKQVLLDAENLNDFVRLRRFIPQYFKLMKPFSKDTLVARSHCCEVSTQCTVETVFITPSALSDAVSTSFLIGTKNILILNCIRITNLGILKFVAFGNYQAMTN